MLAGLPDPRNFLGDRSGARGVGDGRGNQRLNAESANEPPNVMVKTVSLEFTATLTLPGTGARRCSSGY